MSFKVGDRVFVTQEGANEVAFRAKISEVYTIKSTVPIYGGEVFQVGFEETGQVCHLDGIILATELMKVLL
jgi:hypothetical protein